MFSFKLQQLTVGLLLSVLLAVLPALAAPGAHGPNGEHLAGPVVTNTQLAPRFETFSEQFELLAELYDDRLVLHLHHYASNQPVADASLELESAGLTAQARYDSEAGNYEITEPALLQLLQQPQQHELVLTVLTAEHADLLLASFQPSQTATPHASEHEHDHDHQHEHDHHKHSHYGRWLAALVLLVLAAGSGYWLGLTRAARRL